MDRQDVYRAIDSERAYQDCKWGTIIDNPHDLLTWLHLAQEELDEAYAAWRSGLEDAAADELRQVAALAVAALEQHGVQPRKGYAQEPQPDNRTCFVVLEWKDGVEREPIAAFSTREKATTIVDAFRDIEEVAWEPASPYYVGHTTLRQRPQEAE